MDILFIRESMVLKDQEIIREVKRTFDLALIMNYLWRVKSYVVIKSMNTEKFQIV